MKRSVPTQLSGQNKRVEVTHTTTFRQTQISSEQNPYEIQRFYFQQHQLLQETQQQHQMASVEQYQQFQRNLSAAMAGTPPYYPHFGQLTNPYTYNTNVVNNLHSTIPNIWQYNAPPLPNSPSPLPPPLPPPPLPPSMLDTAELPTQPTCCVGTSSNSTERLSSSPKRGRQRSKRSKNQRQDNNVFKWYSQPSLDDSVSANSSNSTPDLDDKVSLINSKAKRKPMSNKNSRSKDWSREDALRVLALEKEYNTDHKQNMLILRFPDPELSPNIVREFSSDIKSVHFQQPYKPRFCFVQVKKGADVEKVRETLSKIPFGSGFISAECKTAEDAQSNESDPDSIDPCTLYVGNLSQQTSAGAVKEHFPGAHRVDIGFAQRMKATRYAFIKYKTVDEAMNAYRKYVNTVFESRSLIVRFRREKGNNCENTNESNGNKELTDVDMLNGNNAEEHDTQIEGNVIELKKITLKTIQSDHVPVEDCKERTLEKDKTKSIMEQSLTPKSSGNAERKNVQETSELSTSNKTISPTICDSREVDKRIISSYQTAQTVRCKILEKQSDVEKSVNAQDVVVENSSTIESKVASKKNNDFTENAFVGKINSSSVVTSEGEMSEAPKKTDLQLRQVQLYENVNKKLIDKPPASDRVHLSEINKIEKNNVNKSDQMEISKDTPSNQHSVRDYGISTESENTNILLSNTSHDKETSQKEESLPIKVAHSFISKVRVPESIPQEDDKVNDVENNDNDDDDDEGEFNFWRPMESKRTKKTKTGHNYTENDISVDTKENIIRLAENKIENGLMFKRLLEDRPPSPLFPEKEDTKETIILLDENQTQNDSILQRARPPSQIILEKETTAENIICLTENKTQNDSILQRLLDDRPPSPEKEDTKENIIRLDENQTQNDSIFQRLLDDRPPSPLFPEKEDTKENIIPLDENKTQNDSIFQRLLDDRTPSPLFPEKEDTKENIVPLDENKTQNDSIFQRLLDDRPPSPLFPEKEDTKENIILLDENKTQNDSILQRVRPPSKIIPNNTLLTFCKESKKGGEKVICLSENKSRKHSIFQCLLDDRPPSPEKQDTKENIILLDENKTQNDSIFQRLLDDRPPSPLFPEKEDTKENIIPLDENKNQNDSIFQRLLDDRPPSPLFPEREDTKENIIPLDENKTQNDSIFQRLLDDRPPSPLFPEKDDTKEIIILLDENKTQNNSIFQRLRDDRPPSPLFPEKKDTKENIIILDENKAQNDSIFRRLLDDRPPSPLFPEKDDTKENITCLKKNKYLKNSILQRLLDDRPLSPLFPEKEGTTENIICLDEDETQKDSMLERLLDDRSSSFPKKKATNENIIRLKKNKTQNDSILQRLLDDRPPSPLFPEKQGTTENIICLDEDETQKDSMLERLLDDRSLSSLFPEKKATNENIIVLDEDETQKDSMLLDDCSSSSLFPEKKATNENIIVLDEDETQKDSMLLDDRSSSSLFPEKKATNEKIIRLKKNKTQKDSILERLLDDRRPSPLFPDHDKSSAVKKEPKSPDRVVLSNEDFSKESSNKKNTKISTEMFAQERILNFFKQNLLSFDIEGALRKKENNFLKAAQIRKQIREQRNREPITTNQFNKRKTLKKSENSSPSMNSLEDVASSSSSPIDDRWMLSKANKLPTHHQKKKVKMNESGDDTARLSSELPNERKSIYALINEAIL